MDTTKKVWYEWLVEEVDAEGDIIDTTSHDNAAAMFAQLREATEPGCHYEYGVIRNELRDRQWAYVVNGLLPHEFDGEAPMPAHIRAEYVSAQV